MIASIGRYLHQPIDAIEEWEIAKLFAYFDTIGPLLEAERGPERS